MKRALGQAKRELIQIARGSEGPHRDLRDRILVAAREEGPSNVVAIRSHRRRWYAAGAAAPRRSFELRLLANRLYDLTVLGLWLEREGITT